MYVIVCVFTLLLLLFLFYEFKNDYIGKISTSKCQHPLINHLELKGINDKYRTLENEIILTTIL